MSFIPFFTTNMRLSPNTKEQQPAVYKEKSSNGKKEQSPTYKVHHVYITDMPVETGSTGFGWKANLPVEKCDWMSTDDCISSFAMMDSARFIPTTLKPHTAQTYGARDKLRERSTESTDSSARPVPFKLEVVLPLLEKEMLCFKEPCESYNIIISAPFSEVDVANVKKAIDSFPKMINKKSVKMSIITWPNSEHVVAHPHLTLAELEMLSKNEHKPITWHKDAGTTRWGLQDMEDICSELNIPLYPVETVADVREALKKITA